MGLAARAMGYDHYRVDDFGPPPPETFHRVDDGESAPTYYYLGFVDLLFWCVVILTLLSDLVTETLRQGWVQVSKLKCNRPKEDPDFLVIEGGCRASCRRFAIVCLWERREKRTMGGTELLRSSCRKGRRGGVGRKFQKTKKKQQWYARVVY